MKQLVILFTFILASAAQADLIATSDGESAPTVSSGRLSQGDAARLFRGEIPDFTRYDSRMVRDRSRCGYGWRNLRASAIKVRPVAAPYETLRAKALRAGVNPNYLDRALATYLKNQHGIPNQRTLTIVDFDKRSDERRLFMIDLATGDVSKVPTSAGRGSDPDGDGYATQFNNLHGRGASSLGCYVAYGTYRGGKFGSKNTLMLHGFEPSNDQACGRALIMHPQKYVGQVPGRSNGCFALRPVDKDRVFAQVNGGLICAYHDGKTRGAAIRTARRTVRRPVHRRPARRVVRATPAPTQHYSVWGLGHAY